MSEIHMKGPENNSAAAGADAAEGSSGVFVINKAARPPQEAFKASAEESLSAILIFIPAYLYVLYIAKGYSAIEYVWCIPAIALFIVGIGELLSRSVKRSAESLVWLFCFAAVCFSFVRAGLLASPEYEMRHVWYSRQLFLFIHIFAVWWVLARSGKLAEGRSGHLLPLDALNGFIVIPFSNLELKLRSVWYAVSVRRASSKKSDPAAAAALIAVIAVCVLLFVNAARLLSAADSSFELISGRLRSFFEFEADYGIAVRLILSIPVASWMFGLIAGSLRTKEAFLQRQRDRVSVSLESIRRVPPMFWAAVVCAFSAMYLLFFYLQGAYLFGAFFRELPYGYTVSAYARRGFFELCKLTVLNFALLWMVTRMSSACTKPVKAASLVLLAENMIFAVIAFSKLMLYIDCFGFTPLRLQSSWLVCVLFSGCAFWMYSLLSARPVFRKWMYLGGVSLALLSLI